MRRRAALKAGRGVPPRASPGKPACGVLDGLAGKACLGVSLPPHFFVWFLPGSNSLPTEAVGPGLGQGLPAAAHCSLGVLFARSCLRDARPARVPCTPGLFSLTTENTMKIQALGPTGHIPGAQQPLVCRQRRSRTFHRHREFSRTVTSGFIEGGTCRSPGRLLQPTFLCLCHVTCEGFFLYLWAICCLSCARSALLGFSRVGGRTPSSPKGIQASVWS